MEDVSRVGGKNASLGEMIGNLKPLGIAVPDGFATTAHAFRGFLDQDGLGEKIYRMLDGLNVEDVSALARTGSEIRGLIMEAPFPATLKTAVTSAWEHLRGEEDFEVAVRSSATAEDLPEASFAGQQETLLNVSGLA
ncbi:MAG: phosphoenolpyruvate synthase, partial [Gemmatimonadota bacterium]|nr:phosphoenolpyruvate synthase [Gemmatimonadota bacterium]